MITFPSSEICGLSPYDVIQRAGFRCRDCERDDGMVAVLEVRIH